MRSKTITVKVITKASKNQVEGFEGEILKVKVTCVPEKGKANEVVIGLIAKYFDVQKSAVKIIKGKTASIKIIHIEKTP